MEKEKMVEELEAILEREQIKIANTVEEFTKLQKVGITRCNAEALYNANCRIVPEGSVVLTKEKLIELNEKGFTFDTTTGDKINLIEMAREIERKEAAMEIFNKLLNLCYDDNHPRGSIAAGEIRYIAKLEYGVEVEE